MKTISWVRYQDIVHLLESIPEEDHGPSALEHFEHFYYRYLYDGVNFDIHKDFKVNPSKVILFNVPTIIVKEDDIKAFLKNYPVDYELKKDAEIWNRDNSDIVTKLYYDWFINDIDYWLNSDSWQLYEGLFIIILENPKRILDIHNFDYSDIHDIFNSKLDMIARSHIASTISFFEYNNNNQSDSFIEPYMFIRYCRTKQWISNEYFNLLMDIIKPNSSDISISALDEDKNDNNGIVGTEKLNEDTSIQSMGGIAKNEALYGKQKQYVLQLAEEIWRKQYENGLLLYNITEMSEHLREKIKIKSKEEDWDIPVKSTIYGWLRKANDKGKVFIPPGIRKKQKKLL